MLILSTFALSFASSTTQEVGREAFSDDSLFLKSGRHLMDGDGYRLENGSILAQSLSLPIAESQVLGVDKPQERDSIISYKVQSGDTLPSIADRFGISGDTIRWANSIAGDNISSGDELLILPTTGVLYYVERGDTLGHIAQRHEASEKDIIEFNEVENGSDIKPGDQLIIPDGKKPTQPKPRRVSQSSHNGFGPVTRGTVTQGAHPGHSNAVDVANSCGTPIFAGGAGTVTRTGTDPHMAGNYIWVDHGSFKALYAHLQTIHVSSGQRVSGGQQIATMGNTGYTLGATGCHIHFETRGGANPFSSMRRGEAMR